MVSIKSVLEKFREAIKPFKYIKDIKMIIVNEETDIEEVKDITNNDLKTQVKNSFKILFYCPGCDIIQTINYDTLVRQIKQKKCTYSRICANDKCVYHLPGKRMSTIEIRNKCLYRNQTLLTSKYEGVKQDLEIECNECKNIQTITYEYFNIGMSCSNRKCKHYNERLDENGILYIKEGNKGEKNLDYISLLKDYNFFIDENPIARDDDIEIKCEKNHTFTSKITIFNNWLNNKKKGNFCNVCEKEVKWNNMIIKPLNDIGITNIITTFDEFETVNDTILTFICPNNTHEVYLSKGNILLSCDKGKFSCKFCNKDNKNIETYNNFKTLLTDNNYIVNTTLKEFIDDNKFEYECHRYHNKIIKTIKSVENKYLKYKDDPSTICDLCNRINKTEDEINKLRENTDEIKKELKEKYDMEFIDYITVAKVKVKCSCGNIYDTSLSDIRRGRKCKKCAGERRKKTNLKIYGTECVFQSDYMKEKAKETNMEKYGVPHHSQNEEIKQKLRNTCREKFGVSFSFCQDFVYEKIRKTHKEIHGVEYPLQSKEIQKKIDNTFMEKYGVRRPFLSEEFRNKIKQIMMNLYGAEYFVESDTFKKQMLEKYGSESYVGSDTFKKQMLEKYGDECPMRVPEIFHKAMRSSFSKKEVILPITKRTLHVMGFEHLAINYILSTKNVFLKRNVEEDEILVEKDVPTFLYNDDDGDKHRYYPDIFIKDTKLIYEVKSVWVFNKAPRMNYLKFMEVARQGYTIKVIIYCNKKKIGDIWTFKKDKTNNIIITSMINKNKGINIEFDCCLEKDWDQKKYVNIIFDEEDEIEDKLNEEIKDVENINKEEREDMYNELIYDDISIMT